MARQGGNTRIGPISLVTLIAVLALAVLAVLAVTTSNASHTMTQRQADATANVYAAERAGQEFRALLDEQLAALRASAGDDAPDQVAFLLADQADALAAQAAQTASATGDAGVTGTATADGSTVHAQFTLADGRVLNVGLYAHRADWLDVSEWKLGAAPVEAPSEGNLWTP